MHIRANTDIVISWTSNQWC